MAKENTLGSKCNFSSANSVEEAVRDAQNSGRKMFFGMIIKKYIDEL